MHHFEKKNSKFFSLEGPCKNVWGPTRMFPRAPLWLSMGLHYLGKTEPTKYCFLLNAVLSQNLNNAQKHILLTFLTVWLTFHPTVSFLNYQQQVCEIWTHCANTGMEMFSAFIDSKIDNVILQTNPDFTCRFLNS